MMSARRARGRGAGQQRGTMNPIDLGAEQPLDRREVLLGERLRRRHQRRLVAVLDRPQHRVQRHHGLAAADLPHQQSLHRRARPQVPRDLLDRAALVAGRARTAARRSSQRWRESRRGPRAPMRRCAPSARRGGAGTRAAPAAAPRRPAAAVPSRGPPPAVGSAWRRARSHGRAAARRHAWPPAAPRDVGQHAALGAHEREDLRRADALGGRVVRDRVAGAGLRGDLGGAIARERVVGDAEAAAGVGLAVQQQARPGRVALDQPRLVEERRPHRPRGVADGRLDERAHPAAAHRRGQRSRAPRPPPSPARRAAARRPCAPRGGRSGRCSSRSPTVRSPSACMAPRRRACRAAPARPAGARAAASARGASISSLLVEGATRRERTQAPVRRAGGRRGRPRPAYAPRSPGTCAADHDRSGGRKRAIATRRPAATSSGLAAVAQLELDAAVDHALELLERRAARPRRRAR